MNHEIRTRQSLWETVTKQSLVTRKMVIFEAISPLVACHLYYAGCRGGTPAWEQRPTSFTYQNLLRQSTRFFVEEVFYRGAIASEPEYK